MSGYLTHTVASSGEPMVVVVAFVQFTEPEGIEGFVSMDEAQTLGQFGERTAHGASAGYATYLSTNVVPNIGY